jgi:DNA-binding transcriptional MerR regulator
MEVQKVSRRDTAMEKLRPDLKLTIDQVSRLTGVKKVTLRYWEKSFGDFLNPTCTGSQRREYTMGDLEIIDSIKKLLEDEHLTNQGVRLRLEQKNGRVRPVR